MEKVDQKLSNAFQFVHQGSRDKALQELHNLRVNIHYIIENMSITSYAFAVTIHEIDGKVITDFSESGLKPIVAQIEKEISQGQIEQLVGALKKKLRISWKYISLISIILSSNLNF
jgi:hypothetical protein